MLTVTGGVTLGGAEQIQRAALPVLTGWVQSVMAKVRHPGSGKKRRTA